MRILTGKNWRDGFLDYHRNKREYRLEVLAWKDLEKLEHVYHTRPKSLRLLINYFPVVGPGGMITKTWSRLREDRRNDKYLGCGFGKIIEAPEQARFKTGETVVFVAPWHPALAERIVLPGELVFPAANVPLPELPSGAALYLPASAEDPADRFWHAIRAWSIYSGVKLATETLLQLETGLKENLKATDWSKAERIITENPAPVSETKGEIPKPSTGKKTGILYGFGNYAKINIIPYMSPFVDIKTVHEIDPTQISISRKVERWDTSPLPKPDEKADVYFVASYNHTHVPITLHALEKGAYVVVEKPVAGDYEELAALEQALKKVGRKLFIGFHKRYGLFNDYALEDLAVKPGDQISYHSVVYELVQPELFWYNWPVSRSTFFANGCHQIDHFLHLNGFSKPKDFDIKLLQDHAVEVWIELENGATFTTTFSEKGTSRVGPRDFVELKVPGRNVRIMDAIRYQSEDEHRILRKKRIFKTQSYHDMYRKIGARIAKNEPGDTIESVMISTKLMLDLEEKLQQLKGWGNRYEEAKKEFWTYFK
ncbi:Gfo/Idh/MocA family oxidoreductase [Patescibacteria group bacterium]|nr:Gfo/Idh/MocA family oxidoreductase [Patescibacteria group bacterium]